MKIIAAILVLILTAFSAFSQQGFHLGAFTGFNSVWIVNQNAWNINTDDEYGIPGATPDPQPELEYRAAGGMMHGLALGYNFTDNIGFQTEFLISNQGQNYEGYYYATIFIERQVRLQYFQIPVMFKFTSNSENARFSVFAGPQFGFLTQARSTMTWEGDFHSFIDPYTNTQETYDDLDVMNRFQPSDIGIALQVGTDIPVADNFYISAGLRLYWGFPDINDPDWRLHKFSAPYDYKKSTSAYGGLNVGFHYLIGEGYY